MTVAARGCARGFCRCAVCQRLVRWDAKVRAGVLEARVRPHRAPAAAEPGELCLGSGLVPRNAATWEKR